MNGLLWERLNTHQVCNMVPVYERYSLKAVKCSDSKLEFRRAAYIYELQRPVQNLTDIGELWVGGISPTGSDRKSPSGMLDELQNRNGRICFVRTHRIRAQVSEYLKFIGLIAIADWLDNNVSVFSGSSSGIGRVNGRCRKVNYLRVASTPNLSFLTERKSPLCSASISCDK